jgi:hypothetical protein
MSRRGGRRYFGGRVARRRHAYRDPAIAITLVAIVAALTACTPQLVTHPTPPPVVVTKTQALSTLTLSPAGLGDIDVGAPVSSTTLIKYGPNLCAPGPGWITRYQQTTDDSSAQPLDPFDVLTEDHSSAKDVSAVFVWSKQIATAAGIRVGSTQAAVEAAYPNAKKSSSCATRVYAVAGATGTVVVEVASHNRFAKGEWPASELGTVVWMFAIRSGAPVKSIAGDDAAGPCPGSTRQPGDID